ncbi:MAG: hypothetical protein GX195_12875 [Firmicutes bacterium]|nr:hypothetical protein [Bacillota bacterium]
MRRQIFLTLILVGVAVVATLQLTGGFSRPSDDDSGIKNVRFNNLTPITPPAANTAGLQASLDRVARTALEGQWAAAALETNRLEDLWQTIRLGSVGSLQIEQAINQGIEDLHVNVLARNTQAVLQTAEQLTAYFGQLKP